MTLVTEKTLNYDKNEISETPIIDYELHYDSIQLTTSTASRACTGSLRCQLSSILA